MDSCNPSKNFALKVEKERKENEKTKKKRYSFQIQKATAHARTHEPSRPSFLTATCTWKLCPAREGVPHQSTSRV